MIYLFLCVEDMLTASRSMVKIDKVEALLSREFEMKDFGGAKRALGLEIMRVRKNEKVVARFRKENSKPMGF